MNLSSETVDQETRGGSPRVWTGLVLNNNYRIGSLIEQGSTFELYDGVQLSTDERVSLKILLPQLAADAKTAALFHGEARIIGRIAHPGLVRYRACGRDHQSDLAYVVMDSPGPRLSARLGTLKPTPEEIVQLTKRLASALAAAHRAGLVHGHLSPANVILPGEKLADASITGFNLTKTESSGTFDRVIASAEYLAPEQTPPHGVDSTIGPWTDIYSLALIGLAALKGKDGSRDTSALPRNVRWIFGTMLKPNVWHRFRSMDEVVDALDRTSLDTESRIRIVWPQSFGATRRASVAAAAVFVAASPWLLQTSLPQVPADARAAPAMVVVEPPGSLRAYASGSPATIAEVVPTAGDAHAPDSIPVPASKPTRQGRASALVQADDNAREAEQTARLNAAQMARVTNSSDQHRADGRPFDDVNADAPVVSETRPSASPTPTFQPEEPERPTKARPAVQSPEPQLGDRQPAASVDPPIPVAVQALEPLDAQAIARGVEERVRAEAERRLREWCKAQRLRCTFPAPAGLSLDRLRDAE